MRVLCCTGLTGNLNGKTAENACRRTVFGNVMEPCLYQRNYLRPHIERTQKFRFEFLHRAAIRRNDAVDQVRLIALAIGSDFAHDHCRLQRRHQIEALTDSRVEGFRQIPVAIFKVFLLVTAVSYQTIGLIRQVNAGNLAQTKHPGIFFQTVNAQAIAHFIEIHVIGMGHSLLEVDETECLPFSISLRDNPVMAAVHDEFGGADDPFGQSRRTRDDLKGRTWRVLTRYGLVVHRMIGIVVEFVPILRRNPMGKQIRVKSRTADHREDFTGLRVHGHHGRRIGINLL